jgi:hypothetical protein
MIETEIRLRNVRIVAAYSPSRLSFTAETGGRKGKERRKRKTKRRRKNKIKEKNN